MEALAHVARRRYLPLVIGASILLIDQMSKYFVHTLLPPMSALPYVYPYGGIALFQNFVGIEFSLSHATNQGAAWGVLTSYQTFLVTGRILLIFTLVLFTACFNKRASYTIPLTLIIAGAIGNVIDSFAYGHVVDFFHFILWGYDYPVFNVADSAIFVGVVSMFLLPSKS